MRTLKALKHFTGLDIGTVKDKGDILDDKNPNDSRASAVKRIKIIPIKRSFSPLMVRIMAVNVVALAILVTGLLYLNQFRDDLINSRVANMKKQAVIISGALGESAILGPEATTIEQDIAEQIIGRLVTPTNNRARLFTRSYDLLVDSRRLMQENTVYEQEIIDPDAPVPLLVRMEGWIYDALALMMTRRELPIYRELSVDKADNYTEVLTALEGDSASAIRQLESGELVVTVAVPVMRFRRVLGALLITVDTSDIDEIVRAEQISTLQIFSGALAVTLLLSFFLGRTIAHPIRRLARAAERVRNAIGREENMPDFVSRRDEIGDLSRALSDMTSALYNQIDAIERFAADVAHELKNPLTSMRSALETMERTKKPEQQKQLLAILADDVKRLDRLITDISDASRLDAELARGDMGKVDLGVLLSTLTDAYRTTRSDSGVTLSFNQGEAGVYLVEGIESRLGQVWRNLIDNAYSFSEAGQTITVSLEIKDGDIISKVRDEGVGFPEGAKDKIFSRFYSERPQNEEFGTHSGLGLAISEQIIHAHYGSISADNHSGGGACFTVMVPLYKK